MLFRSEQIMSNGLNVSLNGDPDGYVGIAGVPAVGQVLSAISAFTDSEGVGFKTYEWYRDGNEIANVYTSYYKLTSADIDKNISVRLSYIDNKGVSEHISSISSTSKVYSTGNDVIHNTSLLDFLTGGKGADTFSFNYNFIGSKFTNSGVTVDTRDTIVDFKSTQNDKIDLSSIDADFLASGNQAFKYIGNAAFDNANATGQLRFDNGILYGSINTDRKSTRLNSSH